MYHRIRVGIAAVLLLMLGLSPVAAQEEATPASGLEAAGLPVLAVTMTDSSYEGIPEQLEAGRYLVQLTVSEEAAELVGGGGIAFVQPPDGMSTDDFLASSIGAPDESGVGEVAGTPVEGVEATPADAGSGIPAFVFESKYAGGIYSFGAPVEVVVDLPPGEWIAWADDPELPHAPVVFQVAGEMPADLPEPDSSATIQMGEYVIQVSEGQLTAGRQVIRIDNIGAQPHFVGWFQGPDGMTEEQIGTVLDEEMQAEMTGTPAAYSGIDPNEDLLPIIFTASQSSNTSIWIVVDLPAGTHGLVCFFPDLADGIPHAFHGMYSIVEVSA